MITFDAKEKGVTLKGFAKDQMIQATTELAEAEKKYGERPEIQVVLVEVDSLAKLRESYPNYYADTSVFTKTIGDLLEKYAK